MIVHLVEIVLLGNLKMYLDDTIVEVTATTYPKSDIQLFRERLSEKKNVQVEVRKDIMGYDRYTFPRPDTVDVEPTFLAFL